MRTTITQSSMRAFRACQRLYQLRYVQGYRPSREPETLHFGGLIHAALEAWWRATGDARLDAALDALAGEPDPFTLAKAEAMILGYHTRWSGAELQVLAVEAEFQAPLINPNTGARARSLCLGGKIDAIVRDRDGRVLVVEHKTSSEDVGPGSDYRLRLRMDPQVSLYFDGAAALGQEAEGCLYDVLVKPRQRPKQGETPEEYRARIVEAMAQAADDGNPAAYFERFEVARLARDLLEARQDVWEVAALVRNSQRTGVAPRNADACVRWGRSCEFLPVCAGEASVSDARYVRSETAHPELERRSA